MCVCVCVCVCVCIERTERIDEPRTEEKGGSARQRQNQGQTESGQRQPLPFRGQLDKEGCGGVRGGGGVGWVWGGGGWGGKPEAANISLCLVEVSKPQQYPTTLGQEARVHHRKDHSLPVCSVVKASTTAFSVSVVQTTASWVS